MQKLQLCQQGDTAIVRSRGRDTSGMCGDLTTSGMNMNHRQVLLCERDDAMSMFVFARERKRNFQSGSEQKITSSLRRAGQETQGGGQSNAGPE